MGSDLVQGVTMALAELSRTKTPQKLLVVVGEGNDTNNGESARLQLLQLKVMAVQSGITVKPIILHAQRGDKPSSIEDAGLAVVDADTMPLRQALADAIGGVAPQKVSPLALEGLRLAGDKQIMPDDATKEAMQRSGKDRIVGTFEVCLDLAGQVTSTDVTKTTGFPAYDTKIVSGIGQWKFKPWMVDGKAVPVCTAVTFIYSQR
ncbi:MAG: hypothetical protein QM831_44160 [Kofleriaceae bacterium]